MDDHGHDEQVAMFGVCPVCARADIRAERAARDAAIRGAGVAAEGTDPEWVRRARKAIRDLAADRDTFTTDDVWERVPRTGEPRALGALMVEAADEGVIVRTDDTIPSRLPARHSRPVRVWASAQQHLIA